jgi:hypothetical protein
MPTYATGGRQPANRGRLWRPVAQEKPIHLPPQPTRDQSAIDVRATALHDAGEKWPSGANDTERRIVNVKTTASTSAVIFVQNAKL